MKEAEVAAAKFSRMPILEAHTLNRTWTAPLCLILGLAVQLPVRAFDKVEDDFKLDEPSFWTHLADVRTEFGYRDNPSYASQHPDASRYAALKLEYTLARLPVDGWQVMALNSSEFYHYFDSQAADHEIFSFTLFQVQKDTGTGNVWEVGLQHVFQDQAIDASTTVLNAGSVYLHGNTLQGYGRWKHQWQSGWWLALKPIWESQWVEAPLDSSQQPSIQTSLGYDHGKISNVSLNYSYRNRAFDTLMPTDRFGVTTGSGTLHFTQHELDATYRTRLDTANHWRLTLRAGWQQNLDNGAGFFDYDKYFAGWDLRWRSKPWEVSLFSRASYYDYPVQEIAGAGTDLRQKCLASVGLQIKRDIGKNWYILGRIEHERSLSNLITDRYEADTLSLGIGWAN